MGMIYIKCTKEYPLFEEMIHNLLKERLYLWPKAMIPIWIGIFIPSPAHTVEALAMIDIRRVITVIIHNCLQHTEL